MIKRTVVTVMLCWMAVLVKAQSHPLLQRDSILSLMRKVARWQINEFAEGRILKGKAEWENSALYTGIVALMHTDTQKKTYRDFLYAIGEDNNWNTGKFRLFADDYCVAQMYTQLYIDYREPKMIARWRALADTIVEHAFSEPLAVIPEINHREWAWCDALFMGPPALAYLSTAVGDLRYIKKADSLWWKTSDYLYDKEERLFYRDSRFFDRKEKNGQKVFWSRGNGWVMGGLVRVMENMPGNFKSRKRYERQFKEMAERIASLQQPDGSWHASLLDPASFPEMETSGTGFYVYALSWGMKHQLLPKKKYLPVVEKAWAAMKSAVHPDGKLGFVQNVGDKPVGAGYESTNVYGVGALLLAGSEMYKLKL
jgi:unsaturated rhamnogalacturonyl hydrolase